MTAFEPVPITPATEDARACCDACQSPKSESLAPGSQWLRAARWARRLSWVSLAWMLTEAVVGLWQGLAAGSIALTGWALGSGVEGLASVIVIWRFTGARTHSPTAESNAQRAVAVSFWLLAPYIAVESIHHLLRGDRAETTVIGIALTAAAVVAMPILGRAKRRLAIKLRSGATAGEGTQNYLCAAQAAAVLVGLAVTAAWPGAWWVDPVIGLGIAAAAGWQGVQSWRGRTCAC